MTEAETERAAVVAWLRKGLLAALEQGEPEFCTYRTVALLASSIERGGHLTNEGK